MSHRAIKPYIPPPVKAPGQTHSMIVDGSPLAIIGIFVAVLRERFTPGNGPTDYEWYDDQNKATVIIESAFEDSNTERGKKAAIFVDKDQSVYGKLIIGDRAGHTIKDGKDFQWTLSTVPILLDCVAGRKGESAILGDIVQWSLHASSDAIQSTFALHDMTPPTLGRTVPYEADKESWSTPVSFQVQYNVRWTTVPIAPLLQEIAVRIQQAGLTPADYFVDLVTRESE
jgi:hypothetical protein